MERLQECIFRCSCALTKLWVGQGTEEGEGCWVSARPLPVKGLCAATLTAAVSSEGGSATL